MRGGSRLGLTLPGEWWSAPVDADAETRAREIAGFVEARYGRRDDLASVRAEHRARLGRALDTAIARGATQFHLSLANEGGVAFATTAAEYALPRVFGGDRAPAVLADRVVAALHADAADGAWAAFEAEHGTAFAKGESIVLRRITRRSAPPDADDVTESLTADYWLTVPGHAEVVLVSLSTVLLQLEPLMLELFDGIVAASEWREEAASLRAELLGEAASVADAGHAGA